MTASGKAEAAPIRAADLLQAVRTRYAPPEWHCEDEVTLAGRRLDVVALNMWSARRHTVVGFEIKVSRGDWMRELTSFQKAEQWIAVCDSFYVVTPPKIIRSDELPEGWGHLELCGSRMYTRRVAHIRPPSTTFPREVAARFITRLVQGRDSFRRETEYTIRREIEDRERKAAREKVEQERTTAEAELVRKAEQYDKLITALDLRYEWKPEDRIIRAVRLVAGLRLDLHVAGRITALAERVDADLKALREAVELAQEVPG